MNVFQDKSLLLPNIRHGFFGKKGGVSKGIYNSLNVGLGSNDAPNLILKNREIVAGEMGVDENQLFTLYQIHSNKVITLTENSLNDNRPEADAMVTNIKGQALGILTADCTPVLFAEPDASIIGAAHAGWKGALDGVLQSTINAMVNLGAVREKIRAVIGPTILQKSYEVGPEFRDNFLNKDQATKAFFERNKNDKFQFDIEGFNLRTLKEAKIESFNSLNLDTYSMKDDFFSFRRTTHQNEPDYGRQISVILLT